MKEGRGASKRARTSKGMPREESKDGNGSGDEDSSESEEGVAAVMRRARRGVAALGWTGLKRTWRISGHNLLDWARHQPWIYFENTKALLALHKRAYMKMTTSVRGALSHPAELNTHTRGFRDAWCGMRTAMPIKTSRQHAREG
eukprot:1157738-Pelagomonas_calceolata.AAC.4